MNENLLQKEIDYSTNLIKKITPYLDHILEYTQAKGVTRPISNRHRAFAWYWVFNGHNKSDAYRRAKWGVFNPKTKEIEVIIPEKQQKQKNFAINTTVNATSTFKKNSIKEAVKLIQENHIENLKVETEQTYLEQLTVQATYDPSMFYTPDGKIAFTNWDEIPQKYRCCIESIQEDYKGKDADTRIITLKLCDRAKARAELAKYFDLQPIEKQEIKHTTIDKKGQTTGILPEDFDPAKCSTEYLQAVLNSVEKEK